MKRWNCQEENSAIEMLKNGKSYKEIGESLGKTPKSVKVKLFKLGFCFQDFEAPKLIKCCENCGGKIKRGGTKFCSHSCSAIVNNKNKTYGIRRSKLEKWLEIELSELFPNLEIHYNRKDTISSELDIYIPSLSLAFELNGIFHYEPIYGEEKLNQIKNNDHRKFAACHEAGISLCVIDTSSQKYVKPSTSQRFLDIIFSMITSRLSDLHG